MIDRITYKERLFVPASFGAPTVEMICRKAESKRRTMRKTVMLVVCIFAAAFVLSNGICYAATGETWVQKLFSYSAVLPNGVKVWEYEVSEGVWAGGAEFHDGDVKDADYTVYENGRTYFVFGKIKKDITDIVAGGKDYYMYEYTDDQGILHRIFVGEMSLAEEYVGGPLIYCSEWWEQIYYAHGRISGVGVIPAEDNTPEWLKKVRQDYPLKGER